MTASELNHSKSPLFQVLTPYSYFGTSEAIGTSVVVHALILASSTSLAQ